MSKILLDSNQLQTRKFDVSRKNSELSEGFGERQRFQTQDVKVRSVGSITQKSDNLSSKWNFNLKCNIPLPVH
jgi:hypothetical protein